MFWDAGNAGSRFRVLGLGDRVSADTASISMRILLGFFVFAAICSDLP